MMLWWSRWPSNADFSWTCGVRVEFSRDIHAAATSPPWFSIISRGGSKENNDFRRAGVANDIVQQCVLQLFNEIVMFRLSFYQFSMKVRVPWCTLHTHHKKIIVVLIENVVPSVSRLKKTEHKCSQGKHDILNLDGPGLAKKYFISSETSILHFWGVYSTKSRFNSSILHHFARRIQ